jgi:LPS sulfotransferase NodH
MVNADAKFVVLTSNRSGSEWVISTLSSCQRVTAHGELFLPRPRASGKKWDSDVAYTRFVERKFETRAFRPFSVFLYLDELYNLPGTIGFKLMYKQLGLYPEISLYLLRNQVRVVHLIRRNHLDVMLSYAVKAKTGQAHLLVGQARPDDLHVQLDVRNLVRRLTWLQKQQSIARNLLRWCRLPCLEVAYEDLVRDRTKFTSILKFLSIESENSVFESPVARIRRQGHRDVISNYDAVKEVLAKSSFAGLLE